MDEAWLEMYLHESINMIEQLELIIIECEKSTNFQEYEINEIFRIMHTIKGSSSMMMYHNIANLAHVLEDLFFYIREEKPTQLDTSTIVDFMLSGIDFIKCEIEKMKEGNPVDGKEDDLVHAIHDYLNYLKNSSESEPTITKYDYEVTIYFQEDCGMENIRAYSIIHKMSEFIDDIYYEPSGIIEMEETIDYIRSNGFWIKFKCEKNYDEMQEWMQNTSFVKEFNLVKVEDMSLNSMEGVSNNLLSNNLLSNNLLSNPNLDPNGREESTKNIELSNTGKSSNMISVNVDKLDKLLDLIGEIVIAQDMVIQNPDLLNIKLDNFKKAATQLSKITSDIQDLVMEIRMVPLQATFLKMNRIIRDMSKTLNKNVDLEIIGEETEVDKKIIELISDPLMHLVRNALDHGIESNEERTLKGKSTKGKITLENCYSS